MSIADIARAAGMSKSYAQKLSVQTTWRGVTIEKVDAFARACGVDLNRPKVVVAYLQNSGLTPLKRGTGAQKRSFKKIIALRKAA